MKRYILSDATPGSDYIPQSFDRDSAYDIAYAVETRIKDKFGKRWKGLSVEIDDISFSDNSVEMQVDVYNKDTLKCDGRFKFTQYEDYFDKADYESHINRKVNGFVDSIY